MGLLSLSRVQSLLENQLGAVEFEDANIPLAVVATDVGSAEKIVMQSGDLAPAVIASMSMPGIFQPVEYNGRMLVDGGLLETVPISILPGLGASYIIGVNVIAKRHYQNPENIIELLANAIDITMNNVTEMQTVHANLLIAPELSAYNPTDTKNIPKLIQVGYEEACRVLDGYLETKKQGL
jgi:NTE family protein